MTSQELASVIKGIGPSIREHVSRIVSDGLAAIHTRVSVLEQRAPAPGPKGDKGDSVVGPVGPPGPSVKGERGEKGDSVDPEVLDGMIVRHAERIIAGLPKAKDGASGRDGKDAEESLVRELRAEVCRLSEALVTRDEMLSVVAIEARKALEALPKPKDGAPGANGRDGRDGGAGPRGEKGADAVPIAGLDAELISASADMLLRKEIAALEAAVPKPIQRRVVRDERGKILRVIEEPAKG